VGVESRLGEPGFSASGIQLPAETRSLCTQTLEHREVHRLEAPIGRGVQLALGLDAAAATGLLVTGALWVEPEHQMALGLAAAGIVAADLTGLGLRYLRDRGKTEIRQSEETVTCGEWTPVADSLLPAAPLGQSLIRDDEQARTLTGIVRSPETDPRLHWSSEIEIDLSPGSEFNNDWRCAGLKGWLSQDTEFPVVNGSGLDYRSLLSLSHQLHDRCPEATLGVQGELHSWRESQRPPVTPEYCRGQTRRCVAWTRLVRHHGSCGAFCAHENQGARDARDEGYLTCLEACSDCRSETLRCAEGL
jgi:hypothetical protein